VITGKILTGINGAVNAKERSEVLKAERFEIALQMWNLQINQTITDRPKD